MFNSQKGRPQRVSQRRLHNEKNNPELLLTHHPSNCKSKKTELLMTPAVFKLVVMLRKISTAQLKERGSLLINLKRRLIRLSNESLNLKALHSLVRQNCKSEEGYACNFSFLCFTGYNISWELVCLKTALNVL